MQIFLSISVKKEILADIIMIILFFFKSKNQNLKAKYTRIFYVVIKRNL